MTNALTNLLTRQMNAVERFIEFAMSHAGLTRDEATRAYATMVKVKALKIDVHGGQFSFTHGAFGAPSVLRRAAKV